MIVFADTSALGAAYLGDEADSEWIGGVVFEGPDPVVVCEIADVELASLLMRAERDGRLNEVEGAERLDAYQDHTADDGPIGVAPLVRETLTRAQLFVRRTSVRTLDAIHLAAAQLLADSSDDDVVLLTLDTRQVAAAIDLGFTIYTRPSV